MEKYLDFFNIYIMGVIEMSFQFYFLIKILNKKLWPPLYFLFAVCAVLIDHFLSAGTIIRFMVLVFLLTACGTLVCRADGKYSLLYAALTTEIMVLCYGIVNSLMSLLCPFLPAVFQDTAGIAVMLVNEALSLALTVFCYFMVYRYFSDYISAEMQQMFLVFIPILMIFIMSEYINTIEFEFQYMVLMDDGPFRYMFSHGQMFAMHLLGLLSLFCILFSYKKRRRLGSSEYTSQIENAGRLESTAIMGVAVLFSNMGWENAYV